MSETTPQNENRSEADFVPDNEDLRPSLVFDVESENSRVLGVDSEDNSDRFEQYETGDIDRRVLSELSAGINYILYRNPDDTDRIRENVNDALQSILTMEIENPRSVDRSPGGYKRLVKRILTELGNPEKYKVWNRVRDNIGSVADKQKGDKNPNLAIWKLKDNLDCNSPVQLAIVDILEGYGGTATFGNIFNAYWDEESSRVAINMEDSRSTVDETVEPNIILEEDINFTVNKIKNELMDNPLIWDAFIRYLAPKMFDSNVTLDSVEDSFDVKKSVIHSRAQIAEKIFYDNLDGASREEKLLVVERLLNEADPEVIAVKNIEAATKSIPSDRRIAILERLIKDIKE